MLKAQKLVTEYFEWHFEPKCVVCKQVFHIGDNVFFIWNTAMPTNPIHQRCYTGIETLEALELEWAKAKEYEYWYTN